jgi:5-methylcytosine-specific restriction endonuclease McrA
MKHSRQEIHDKYDGHCAYCGKKITLKQMQVDHLIPKSQEHYMVYDTGNWVEVQQIMESYDNLMPSCRRCNHYKRAHTLHNFRVMMKSLHERIKKIYIVKVAIDYGIVTFNEWDEMFYFEHAEEMDKLFGYERKRNIND